MPNINDLYPSAYLKASDLKGTQPVVTIAKVEFEAVGREKEMKPIVYFQGKDKGIVCNKTNARTIATLAGSNDTEDWIGFQIRLYATHVEFAGEQVEAIRIKAAGAKPRPVAVVAASAPDIDDSDIPFAWLLPLALPLIGMGSLLLS